MSTYQARVSQVVSKLLGSYNKTQRYIRLLQEVMELGVELGLSRNDLLRIASDFTLHSEAPSGYRTDSKIGAALLCSFALASVLQKNAMALAEDELNRVKRMYGIRDERSDHAEGTENLTHSQKIPVSGVETLLEAGVEIPTFGSSQAAARDLRCTEHVILKPGEQKAIDTGVRLNIQDPNLAVMLLPRSGLGVRGLVIANTVGLIDSDYQGPLIVTLWNRHPTDTMEVSIGERIAQMVFVQIARPDLKAVKSFSTVTERGEGGFGSTGTK